MSYLFFSVGIAGTLLLIISLVFEKSFYWLCKNPRTCFWSPTVLFTAVMVLGYSGGIISFTTSYPDMKVFLLGLGLAAISTVVTNLILEKYRKIEDETLMESELIGSFGTVITTIPAGGYGEVEVDVNGSVFSVTASSNDSLDKGDKILVETITSPGTVKVVPAQKRK